MGCKKKSESKDKRVTLLVKTLVSLTLVTDKNAPKCRHAMLCLRGSAFVIVDYPSGLTTYESRFQTNNKNNL